MKAYAALLEALVYTQSRNAKLALLERYFAETPDPDRGWALASLAGALSLRQVRPALVKGLLEDRVDPVLFRLSYDYVGDLAETASLIWPDNGADNAPAPSLGAVVETLQNATRRTIPELLVNWLDALGPSERFALLKLTMGGMRVGVSARLARTALARMGAVPLEEIEEIWFGLTPPYTDMFNWLQGDGDKPTVDTRRVFHPMMLANPLDTGDLDSFSPSDFVAEWKWDGIRVQLNAGGGSASLYSRTGEDIGESFPDIIEVPGLDAVIDGELLVVRDGTVAGFNDLQQRLGRKSVGAKMLAAYPARIRAYDLLFVDGHDLRAEPLDVRRHALETWHQRARPPHIDLSPLLSFSSWDALAAMRDGLRAAGIEGIMLKRRDSPYTAGRPKGPWFKWKRDPFLADCVLMYAQRGHGRRSSLYSDYTFGCWRTNGDGEEELVPVGKAYSGFTDEELTRLDKWVRDHGRDRYGPVRAVEYGLVFEVAFDAIHPSKRHKSGVAMRFPRIHRIRWDKPYREADRVETLTALIET